MGTVTAQAAGADAIPRRGAAARSAQREGLGVQGHPLRRVRRGVMFQVACTRSVPGHAVGDKFIRTNGLLSLF